MIRHKKPMAIWLARSRRFGSYHIGMKKKEWDGAEFVEGGIASFCDEDFERVTGLRLEHEEIVRVQINVDVFSRK